MAELTRAQAAAKAGLDQGYLDRLIQLDIIQPDAWDRLSTGDVRRAKMAETLEGAGIGLETLAAGMQSGRLSLKFMDAPAYQRFATLSDETFRQVSERTKVPIELLMVAARPPVARCQIRKTGSGRTSSSWCRSSRACCGAASAPSRSSASYGSWGMACAAWPRHRAMRGAPT